MKKRVMGGGWVGVAGRAALDYGLCGVLRHAGDDDASSSSEFDVGGLRVRGEPDDGYVDGVCGGLGGVDGDLDLYAERGAGAGRGGGVDSEYVCVCGRAGFDSVPGDRLGWSADGVHGGQHYDGGGLRVGGCVSGWQVAAGDRQQPADADAVCVFDQHVDGGAERDDRPDVRRGGELGDGDAAADSDLAEWGLPVVVALGAGGDAIFTFNTTTGVATEAATLPLATASDNAVAFDATSSYVFVARGPATSGSSGLGVVSFSLASTGALTQVGSVAASGNSPYGLLLDSTGAFVYAANRGDGTISGYSVASGVLTGLASSPYASGLATTALGCGITVGSMWWRCRRAGRRM